MRQASNFINQRNRYMVVMAQNLYFHAMADNRGVMTLLADRAAEEDVKEEMLLYSVLAKERVNIARPEGQVDEAIEQYLKETFDIDVDFDVEDALAAAEAGRHRHRTARRHAARRCRRTRPPRSIDKLWDCLVSSPTCRDSHDRGNGGPAAAKRDARRRRRAMRRSRCSRRSHLRSRRSRRC